MINIALFGPPGVGKGLQSQRLLQKYPIYKHIAPGNIFRVEIKKSTVLGNRLHSFISKGNLVPEEMVVDTVTQTLSAAHRKDPKQCFLFDGYPRSKHQAVMLDKQLANLSTRLHLFILLEANVDTIKKRLALRRTLEGRDDDTLENVVHRLRLYKDYSRPIIDHYSSDIVVRIDGSATPETVTAQIAKSIDRLH